MYFHSGLNTGVATFQGFRLEGVHCKQFELRGRDKNTALHSVKWAGFNQLCMAREVHAGTGMEHIAKCDRLCNTRSIIYGSIGSFGVLRVLNFYVSAGYRHAHVHFHTCMCAKGVMNYLFLTIERTTKI